MSQTESGPFKVHLLFLDVMLFMPADFTNVIYCVTNLLFAKKKKIIKKNPELRLVVKSSPC